MLKGDFKAVKKLTSLFTARPPFTQSTEVLEGGSGNHMNQISEPQAINLQSKSATDLENGLNDENIKVGQRLRADSNSSIYTIVKVKENWAADCKAAALNFDSIAEKEILISNDTSKKTNVNLTNLTDKSIFSVLPTINDKPPPLAFKQNKESNSPVPMDRSKTSTKSIQISIGGVAQTFEVSHSNKEESKHTLAEINERNRSPKLVIKKNEHEKINHKSSISDSLENLDNIKNHSLSSEILQIKQSTVNISRKNQDRMLVSLKDTDFKPLEAATLTESKNINESKVFVSKLKEQSKQNDSFALLFSQDEMAELLNVYSGFDDKTLLRENIQKVDRFPLKETSEGIINQKTSNHNISKGFYF